MVSVLRKVIERIHSQKNLHYPKINLANNMQKITDISQLDLNGTYTYADYLTWWFDDRLELIKGKIFKMSPAPSFRHQRLAGDIYTEIKNFVKKNKGIYVLFAPFDVRLPKKAEDIVDEKIYNVVQPDICVICDSYKIDEKGCIGAPDLIVEILSMKNSKHDVDRKFKLYEESGVKEYWIVFPGENTIQKFELVNNKYNLEGMYGDTDIMKTNILPGFELLLEEVFEE